MGLHDGMELILIHQGMAPLAFEAQTRALQPGQSALSWAAVPRVILTPCDAVCTVVTIPLERFLAWRLPEAVVSQLLAGDARVGLVGDVEDMAVLKWEDDLATSDPYVRRAAELEIQACVLRLARTSSAPADLGVQPAVWRQAVAFILNHLDEDLSVERVAEAVGRHPSHAMRLFRQQTGFTLGEFIRRHRLARAKRLLIGTRLPVSAIVAAVGFGSERRFFEAFHASVGCSPGVYRRRMRSPDADVVPSSHPAR